MGFQSWGEWPVCRGRGDRALALGRDLLTAKAVGGREHAPCCPHTHPGPTHPRGRRAPHGQPPCQNRQLRAQQGERSELLPPTLSFTPCAGGAA